jgi:hypothetical protein
LQAYGSLTDAIRQRAEQVYAMASDGTPRTPDEQQALLQTFLDLVEVSLDDDARRDVRRRRTITELVHDRAEWEKTIDELATARLLSCARLLSPNVTVSSSVYASRWHWRNGKNTNSARIIC